MPIFSSTIQDIVSNKMPAPYYRFDGSDDVITVADSAHLDLGTGDGTYEMLVKFPDVSVDINIFSRYTSSNDRMKMNWDVPANVIEAYFRVGGTTLHEIVAPFTLVANTWYHMCWVIDNGDANYLYINGVLITLGTDTSTGGNMSLAGAMVFGEYNTDFSNIEFGRFRQHNHALTATEVKELYSGASVPYKYKGANQTSVITGDSSNFAGGVGTWIGYSGGAVAAAAADWTGDAGTGQIKMTFDNSGNCGMSTNGNVLTQGKRYGVSIKAKLISGTSTGLGIGSSDAESGTNGTNRMVFTPTGTETVFTGEFTAGGSAKLYILDSESNSATQVFVFDDFTCTPIGAVAEYDGSGIASDKWFDKSGNDLHGTVSGATVENAPSGEDEGLVYETGTWTPTYDPGTNDFTEIAYNMQSGIYTRIGNVCYIHCDVRTSSLTVGSASGNLDIIGLPFAVAIGGHGATGHSESWGSNSPLQWQIFAAQIRLMKKTALGGDSTNNSVSDMTTGVSKNEIHLSAFYYV